MWSHPSEQQWENINEIKPPKSAEIEELGQHGATQVSGSKTLQIMQSHQMSGNETHETMQSYLRKWP